MLRVPVPRRGPQKPSSKIYCLQGYHLPQLAPCHAEQATLAASGPTCGRLHICCPFCPPMQLLLPASHRGCSQLKNRGLQCLQEAPHSALERTVCLGTAGRGFPKPGPPAPPQGSSPISAPPPQGSQPLPRGPAPSQPPALPLLLRGPSTSPDAEPTCALRSTPTLCSPLDVGMVVLQEVIVVPPILKNILNETA